MNQEFLNPRFLKYFISVAETGSILSASVELSISQPSITRVIQIIEKNFNKTLFVRSKKGVELTEDGEIFYFNAKSIINFNNKVIENLKSKKIDQIVLKNKKITIGIANTLSSTHKENLLWIIKKNYFDMKIIIIEEDSFKLNESIQRKKIDFAFTCIDSFDENEDKKIIYEDPFCVAFYKGHPFQNLKTISLEKVRKEKNYIFRNNCEFFFYNHLKKNNISLNLADTNKLIKKRKDDFGQNDVIYTNSDATAAACVKSGLGVAIIPESVAVDHKLLFHKLNDPSLARQVLIVKNNKYKDAFKVSLISLKNAMWL